jgi:Fe-S-cluster containining protein
MDRSSAFSYRCGCCGLCCHAKVITLAPYDVMRMAEAAGSSTAEIIARYTLRRGSLLRFRDDGSCAALKRGLCTIHAGRPLPCRLYPLGLERTAGGEQFITLEPAPGSSGVYGEDGTVAGFLDQQRTESYLAALEIYAALLPLMRSRIADLVDFDQVEPREFRRIAVREALAESGYDHNPLIDALFDSDPWSGFADDATRSPLRHRAALRDKILAHTDAAQIAAAAALLAVSLGYTPAEIFVRLPVSRVRW